MEDLRQTPSSLKYSAPLSVSVDAHYDGTTLVLGVRGEVDVDTAERLLAELVAALRTDLDVAHVDLTGLTFCSLAGSDALHVFARLATSRGVRVDLDGMSPLLTLMYNEFAPGMPHAESSGPTVGAAGP